MTTEQPDQRCIFRPCVATWRHRHGDFPGGYDNPEDPSGPPIPFEGEDPEPTAVRDYNGARLTEAAVHIHLPSEMTAGEVKEVLRATLREVK